MSIFNFSDTTPAGAFANAVTAAQDSDRRSAGRQSETGGGLKVTGSFASFVRGIAVAITANCSTSRPASRPA